MLLHARVRRLLTAGVFVCYLVLMPRVGRADTLPHYVLTSSLGVPLRLTVNDSFAQDRLAPAFFDALAGYVFPSTSRFAHGAALGFSLNLGKDGGFTEPVTAWQQFVLMPTYLLHYRLAPEWFALGHAGLPIALNAGTSVGLEAAAGVGYRLLAGLGAYAEAGLDFFGGAGSTVHASLSLELGLFVDYEVLP